MVTSAPAGAWPSERGTALAFANDAGAKGTQLFLHLFELGKSCRPIAGVVTGPQLLGPWLPV